MFAVEVIPIQRSRMRGSLSFFSKESVPLGSVVQAPLRGKAVPALVISVRDVREEKLDLKTSGFALKKLGTREPRQHVREVVLTALCEAARYTLKSEGSLIAQLTFSELLTARGLAEPEPIEPSAMLPETLALQAEDAERTLAYKGIVREAFARGTSVLILVPSLADLERLSADLSRGIEESVVLVSSQATPHALRGAWNRVARGGPHLVIGTPPALTFPIARVGTIIVEREGARAYMTRGDATFDVRVVARCVAAGLRARLILADFPLRAEVVGRVQDRVYEEVARPQARTLSGAHVSVVDVRTHDLIKKERRSFSPLQEETLHALAGAVGLKKHAVVYAARTGYAPLTVCNDCGTPVTDPVTQTPMVLHKTPRGNVFFSHRTGALREATDACATCGGWNLVSLGIGVERVYDVVSRQISPVFLFTQETVKTHRAAQKLVADFIAKPGAVLVGTERMLPYLPEVELSVVASIDSMLSRPEWRAEERALHILFSLMSRTNERVIVETRRPDSRVMRAVALGGPQDFLREELVERKTYHYPPYALFVSLSWAGTEARVAERKKEVLDTFRGFDLVGPLPPESLGRGQFRQKAVLRLDPKAWPDERVISRVRTLTPDIVVTVDPDDIV